MKQENIYGNYDVRVSVYETTRGADIATIIFFNDVHELLDCKRVKLEKRGSRLYFNSSNSKGSVILSHKKLQFYRKESVELCREFNGVYALECDVSKYYIDLEHKDTIDFNRGPRDYRHPNYKRKVETPKPVLEKDETEVKEKPKAKVIERPKAKTSDNDDLENKRFSGRYPWISDKEMINYYIRDILKNKKIVITIELEDK